MVQQDGGTEQSRVPSALFPFTLKEDSEEQGWSRGAASVSVLDVHGVLVSDVIILTAAHHHASGILLIGDPSVSFSAE